ncbi:MAG TPA: 16S rRNA (adenine(1518)-N(6)/adenine(1519)-N(6))-dimethyltransferase RsmA [Opitutaceae bacterium]|nr:16S rRNA (adenine(1518)-N(6)/adenine(1519)-N(6))-dimethyltransferase RsmA [Opitutaceae bacterium]
MPLSPSATRELLGRLGHEPKRRLGQNFLVDGNIVRKSLALAELAPGERVVEIGPGLGTLTRALLEGGAEVWAIERDAALFRHLAAELAPASGGRLHLMEGDALEHPLAGLPPGTPFKIVANLPYAISSPWLEAVLAGPLPGRMVLMLQREAAERYAARAGSKSFGAISIFLQAAYDVAPGHRVAAACFHPAPEIESQLLHLVRKPEPFVFPAPARALIRGVFQQRRKQLGSLLRGRLPDGGAKWLEHIAAAGLSPQARPESVPAALWVALAAAPA